MGWNSQCCSSSRLRAAANAHADSMIGGIGEGTWEQVGNEPRFNVSLVIELSNGTKLRSVGVADNKTRTLNGHNYAVE